METLMKRELEYIPVADLIPYVNNARTHSDEQIAKLAGAIKQFSFTNPLIIDQDGMILAGHGRLAAARKLGMDEVPCIRVPLSGAAARAYILADNRMAELAGWDNELLRVELDFLREDGFDLDLTGFDEAALAELYGDTLPSLDGDKDPDEAPELPETPTSVLGDIWLLGPHKVRCGDSTKLDDWLALMGDEKCDCVWTDPPYNVAYESKLAGSIKNDNMADESFHQFLLDFYSALITVMKPGAPIYVAHADTEGLNFRGAFKKAGFKLSGCLIWKKNSLVLGRSDYQWMHEPILYGWKPGSGHKWYGGRKQVTVQELGDSSPFEKLEDGRYAIKVGDSVMYVSGEAVVEESPASVIYCEKPKRSAEHPTMKPTALIEKMLKHSARPGDIIVDGFGGSGSTLIAADRMGMSARLMEYDPKFVDVIVRRWQDYTGRRAVHAVTGKEFPLAS